MNLEKYTKMYQIFTTKIAQSGQHLESLVLDSEKEVIMTFVKEAGIIYDLGTGAGRIPLFLASFGFKGQIVGVDSNYQMISQAGASRRRNITFVNEDILNWLKKADPADLIICMGNTVGGFIDEQYRASLLSEVFSKIGKAGYFIMDYRPADVVIKEDVVLERKSQKGGELIVTEEEILNNRIELCQFYPDESFNKALNSIGFSTVKEADLKGAKYFRKIVVLRSNDN